MSIEILKEVVKAHNSTLRKALLKQGEDFTHIQDAAVKLAETLKNAAGLSKEHTMEVAKIAHIRPTTPGVGVTPEAAPTLEPE